MCNLMDLLHLGNTLCNLFLLGSSQDFFLRYVKVLALACASTCNGQTRHAQARTGTHSRTMIPRGRMGLYFIPSNVVTPSLHRPMSTSIRWPFRAIPAEASAGDMPAVDPVDKPNVASQGGVSD